MRKDGDNNKMGMVADKNTIHSSQDNQSQKEPQWSEHFQRLLDETIEELRKEYPLNIKQIEEKEMGFSVTGLIILAINIYRRKVIENMQSKGIGLTINNNFSKAK